MNFNLCSFVLCAHFKILCKEFEFQKKGTNNSNNNRITFINKNRSNLSNQHTMTQKKKIITIYPNYQASLIWQVLSGHCVSLGLGLLKVISY